MRLLVLGGTVFVGRALVEAAVAAGHEVTVLNRGLSGRAPTGVEALRGDRTRPDGLAALGGRHFDAVVDTCRQDVHQVRRAATELAERTRIHAFVSTISVYADLSRVGITEDDPLRTYHGQAAGEDAYGALKVICERAVHETRPAHTLVVRPGLVAGPGDPTDRFTYWPARLAAGGEVLAPGAPDGRVQFVDVRDLAMWTLGALTAGRTGTFNVVGPAAPLEFAALLDACAEQTASRPTITWVDDAFLLAEGVMPYTDLPLWVPRLPELAGFAGISAARAMAAGLAFRPVSDTIRDTLAWRAGQPVSRPWRAGLSRQREAALLRAWRHR